MAWDDTKSPGSTLTAAEWNDHVADQKGHQSRHAKNGSDPIQSTLDGRAIALTTRGDIVYASDTNTIARLAAGTAGYPLVTGGANADPYWGQIDHGTALTGLGDDDHTIYLKAAGGRNWSLPTPSDSAAEGIIINATAGENVGAGDICYLKSDGKFWLADADAETTTKGMLALATTSISADTSGNFLVYGKYRKDSWDWTVSGELYVHTSPGSPTQTRPSGSGKVVRIVGHALTADIIFFAPSQTYITLA